MVISYFENVRDTTPKNTSLEQWIKDTICPCKKLKKKILKYRKTKDKNIKLEIPCATPSAAFAEKRNLDNIIKKNGVICIDVDKAANPVADMGLVKAMFKTHTSTIYVGYSVSGEGIYAIIKTSNENDLLKYFEYFERRLKNIGVVIDGSCKDYTRLRFLSYDPKGYYNPSAKPFSIPVKAAPMTPNQTGSATKTETDKVEAIISVIEQNSMDITSDYSDWVKIAGALYNSFGEGGRSFFHRISRMHPEYKESDTDAKFNGCTSMSKVSLSSLFYIANSYGVRY